MCNQKIDARIRVFDMIRAHKGKYTTDQLITKYLSGSSRITILQVKEFIWTLNRIGVINSFFGRLSLNENYWIMDSMSGTAQGSLIAVMIRENGKEKVSVGRRHRYTEDIFTDLKGKHYFQIKVGRATDNKFRYVPEKKLEIA